MEIAIHYYDIYLLVVTIYTIYYVNKSIVSNIKTTRGPIYFLLMFLVLFIGLRPTHEIFADMIGYVNAWDFYAVENYSFSKDVQNLIFDNLRIAMASAGIDIYVFFVFIATIYFIGMFIACKKIFPSHTEIAFLVCLAAFSTFSYATNGIKAGAAASIFLIAIAYHDNFKITIPLALTSWGFHHSMVMVVASYIIVLFYNKPRWFFILWIISVGIAAAHITTFQDYFYSVADEKGQSYLEGQMHGKGFRIDFILYSAMPVLVGYYAIFKKKIQSKAYNIVLCLYLITNSIWMLCMYAEFTNRIAYLSWFQYPIVLIYPFLKEKWGNNQYKIARKVIYAHLAFTIFMKVVYYN